MEKDTKYEMRIVRGALTNTNILDALGAVKLEDFDHEWIELDKVIVTLNEIRQIQKLMVRRYGNQTDPWYMDGVDADDKNNMIVAFGADDGEGGRTFLFNKNDISKIKEIQQYGISKGIPPEQMDFNKSF